MVHASAVSLTSWGESSWADQSGNSRDADGTGHAPQYVFSVPALNGQPAIRFDGSSEYLGILNQILPTTTDEMTILAVAKAAKDSSVSIVGIRGASRPLIQLDQDSSGKARFIVRDSLGGTLNSTELKHTGGYGIYAGTLTTSGATSTATVSYAGTSGTSPSLSNLGTLVSNPSTLDQRIGGAFDGSNTYHWQGDIAEVIVYDRALSSTEMDQAGYYLQSKYGLAWDLPANGRELWLRADAGVTTDASGMVTRWDDVSGTGGYAVADAGVGPHLVPSEGSANGQPTLRFNGADERMGIVTHVLTGSPEEYTIFAVAKADRNSNPSILGLRTNTPFLQLDQDAAGHARFIVRNAGGTTATALGDIHTGDYGIYTAMMTESGGTSTAHIYFDGVLEGTASADFGGAIDFNVAQRIGGTDGAYYWQGDIAELLVYNRALSDIERAEVESYLYGKYVPEPATMTLLAIGGLGILIRRRRRSERG